MKKLYYKYKGKEVTFKNGVCGVVCGYTASHFLLSVNDSDDVSCFSLEELAHQDYFIDSDFLEHECLLFMYADENQL